MLLSRKKLIQRSDGKELFFDLGSDPGEIRNLLESSPQLAAKLREQLRERTWESDPSRVSKSMEIDDESMSDPRSLGYLN